MKHYNLSGIKALIFLIKTKKNDIVRHIRHISAMLTLLLWALPSHAAADSVTLAWDANQPQPDGYRVHHRTSGQSYDYSSWDCQTTDTICTVNNLGPGTTYHFVVRAYMGRDVSSDSNEVSHTTASPAPLNHKISASAGPHGMITPSGEVSVAEGGNQRFNIAANAGYHISDVLVDDQSVGAVSSYRFTDISTHHSIKAQFELSNRNPHANAGPDQTVDEVVEVILDGGSSHDPDTGDSIASFQWLQTDGTSVHIANLRTAHLPGRHRLFRPRRQHWQISMDAISRCFGDPIRSIRKPPLFCGARG